MVIIYPGFYFCHTFDLGSKLVPFKKWIERESLPVAPSALRYREIIFPTASVFINELGFAVVFQSLPDATNYEEANQSYKLDFDIPYTQLCDSLNKFFGRHLIKETSFILEIGSQKLVVDWSEVHAPNNSLSATILIEALFIDELCRALERLSDSFLGESSLAEDRLLVEYAECLFPLSRPAGFLVSKPEIGQMEEYFEKWSLGERVMSLRARFAESVTNTALYRGHLEQNRQGALNAVLAGIALLSLAQVSKPISEVLSKINVLFSETQLNQAFVLIAIFLMILGGWRYIVRPMISIWSDNIKRMYFTWRTTRDQD